MKKTVTCSGGGMAKILLTGASGFIGTHLYPALQQAGHEVVALAGRQAVNLCDATAVAALPPCEVIVHLAGAGNPTDFDRDPATSWEVNVAGTLHLLNYARACQAQHFILASTYVYGAPEHLPVSEEHPVRPPHAYPRSKYLCEQMLAQFVKDAGLRGTSLRVFNVYGPGQSAHMLIPTLLRQVFQAQMQLQNPVPRRDFVHVHDVVQAFVAACARSGEAYATYNIGSGSSLSVAELVDLLLRLAGTQPTVTYSQQVRSGEVNEVVADIAKAARELGWHPSVALEQGLQELLCAS
jgi:GDP-4-dehydro-6-deoxy-D-mannose reductase